MARGDLHRRRRQRQLQGLATARGGAVERRAAFRRLRRVRRRVGTRARLRADVRRERTKPRGCSTPYARILAPAPDRGWLHCGPAGSGHFVKMIHNGIEYGMMQAMAEGFALLEGKQEFGLDLAGDRRDLAARQRRALVAARPHRRVPRERCEARGHRAVRRRLRRRSLDRQRGRRAGHVRRRCSRSR